MNEKEREELALARYHLVTKVLQPDESGLTRGELYQKVAEQGHILPSGQEMKFTWHSLERWVRNYSRHGFDGLRDKPRNDKGCHRKLTDEIKDRIASKVEEFPRMPATMVYTFLSEEGLFDKSDLSLSTVTRFIRQYKNEAGDQLLLGQKEKRRYEKAHINEVWYGDTTYSVHIKDENGKKRQVYIIALIDDASRLVVACEAFFQDNTESLMKVIETGIRRYGVPQLFSFDNGKNYRNSQIRYLSARIGVALNYAPPYTPQSKAKIERFFGTLKQQWQSGLSEDEMSSLEKLNTSLLNYILRYNTTVHSSLDGVSPTERFFKEGKLIHTLPDDQLDTLFYFEDKRKVTNDGLIKVANTFFETDYRFSRKEVQIRYLPDMSKVWVQDGRKLIEARPLNKIDNSDMKRKTFKLTGMSEHNEEGD